MIKDLIKNTPFFGKIAVKIYSRIKGVPYFSTSKKYWDDRYKSGGNSGAGSYARFAEFKAEVINKFVKDNAVDSVIEFGSGDGNQLKYFQFKNYTGFDVSPTAVALCTETFKNDPSKKFKLVGEYANHSADLTMSLDVIYHLIEDSVYREYMQRLFDSSKLFVIIYASNKDEVPVTGVHVKHRKFTNWVDQHAKEFKLISHIPNKYPWNGNEHETSFADFYIYQRSL